MKHGPTPSGRKYDYERIYGFIVAWKRSHDGNSPTLRDIMDGCDIKSTSNASYILNCLVEAGKIRLSPGRHSRMIYVVNGQWSLR